MACLSVYGYSIGLSYGIFGLTHFQQNSPINRTFFLHGKFQRNRGCNEKQYNNYMSKLSHYIFLNYVVLPSDCIYSCEHYYQFLSNVNVSTVIG